MLEEFYILPVTRVPPHMSALRPYHVLAQCATPNVGVTRGLGRQTGKLNIMKTAMSDQFIEKTREEDKYFT